MPVFGEIRPHSHDIATEISRFLVIVPTSVKPHLHLIRHDSAEWRSEYKIKVLGMVALFGPEVILVDLTVVSRNHGRHLGRWRHHIQIGQQLQL